MHAFPLRVIIQTKKFAFANKCKRTAYNRSEYEFFTEVQMVEICAAYFSRAIAAASSACFILPNNLVIGGTTGIGIFVGHFWNENAVSIVALIANIILYVIGVFLLGKKFAMSTLLGTVLYPVFMGLFSMAIGDRILTDDKLLACICGGLFMGIGIGIVVREGASTGGTDIPPLILNKYFGLPVSVGVWIVDLTIVFMQAVTM